MWYELVNCLIFVYFGMRTFVESSKPDVSHYKPVIRSTDEQRLLQSLFLDMDYDPKVRPVYNSSKNVEITFGFTLIQILDLEEINQVLVTNAWLTHEWLDERLTWDPVDYNGLKIIRIPASLLWLPDIVLYSNADDYTTGYMESNAMVTHTGGIFWGPPARLRSSCQLDITYFPFDSQICRMKFGSWTYTKAQVDILNKTPEVELTNYVSNGEWQLTKYDIERSEYTYPGTKGIFPDVTIVLEIHRRVLYYVMNIILPCIWLSILNLLNFCLPPDECEKITLGITVFLSYSVFMLLVANSMPPTSEYLPLIGMYLTLSMAVACASVILTVLVLKTYHVSPNQKEVPRWVRTIILQGLARLTRCERPPVKRIKRRLSTKPKLHTAVKEVMSKIKAENSAPRAFNLDLNTLLKASRNAGDADDKMEDSAGSGVVARTAPDAVSTVSSIRSTAIDDILGYLKLIVDQEEDESLEDDTNDEWRQVALVIDRLLFWIFLLINFVSSFVILIITPNAKSHV